MSEIDDLLKTVEAPSSELVSRPIEEPIKELDNKPTAEVVEIASQPPVDVRKYLDRLDLVTDEVLQSCRTDRQDAQDVINLIRSEIDKEINKNLSPGRALLENLVAAIEVKAGINGNAVKVLEAAAKTLAATKASLNVQNINVANGGGSAVSKLDMELTDILASSPEYKY